ncbi:MAG: hypothetical protein HY815_26155 [Candidatus Riflebacteria bacterium]|nr:hypothetical protein [Candidatus Riflebacteria bacterium]
MGIDYLLDLDCAPRKQLGTSGLLDAAKLCEYAREIEALEAHGSVSAAEPLKVVRMGADFTLDEETLTVSQLRSRAAAFDGHRARCNGCPANVCQRLHGLLRPFGCHGSIRYPLSHELEFLLQVTARFVTTRLLDQPPGQLVRFVVDSGITGDQVRSLREHARAGQPAVLVREAALPCPFVDADGGETTIDTDQLLEVILFGGKIEPQVVTYLLSPFFQVMESVASIVSQESDLRRREHLTDPGLVQLREFGRAVVLAGELGVPVLIDR